MKRQPAWLRPLTAALALTCLCATTLGLPLITSVVETGGDNEATDTITARMTGETWTVSVANEPVTGKVIGDPYLVPLFGEDVPCYVDRNHQWNGATLDQPIPDYLVGGEYIMSGNDNRDNAGYRLDVTVSDAAIVYVLIDNRYPGGKDNATPPNYDEGVDPAGWTTSLAWLGTEGFQPVLNGLNRALDPSFPDEIGVDEGGNGTGPGGDIQQWSSVYSKILSGPGTFSVFQADNAGNNMYGVVVKRLPNSVNNPPEVSNLTPANNTLFHPAASGLSFTAKTISPNSIAPANIKLALNGADVSAALTITGSATSRSVTYAALQPDTLYRGQIIVSDQAGRATTNNFGFDTFVAATAVAVEAEDYNYSGGQTEAAPPPGAFASKIGTRDVDFHNNTGVGPATPAAYRPDDFVGQAASGDVAREAFTSAGATDYVVNGVQAGDWLNYTRTLTGAYQVYLRGATAAAQSLRLDRITDATATAQEAFALGTFSFSGGASAFEYAPLTDGKGAVVVLSLSGATALRVTALSANVNLQLNYLLLVPVTAPQSPAYLSSASPAPGATGVAPDAAVQIILANGATQVTPASVALKFNGADVTTAATVTPVAQGVVVTYDPPGSLELGTAYPVSVTFGDSANASTTADWTFTTLTSLTVIPANYGTASGSGQNGGVRLKMRKATDAVTLLNTADRADQQLADTLIDPSTEAPYENEAGGPNNDGLANGTLVNFDQLGVATGYFGGDQTFPYVDPGFYPDPNNLALEVTTYLDLTAGIHRLGVRSDDGFRLACGPGFTEANLVLGVFEGGRGNDLAAGATEFDFLVEQDGVYAMRLIWYEGNGGANVEWYSVDRATFTRTLINDTAKTGAVKAYRDRSTIIGIPTVTITSPTDGTTYPTGPQDITVTASASVPGGTITLVEFFAGANKIGEATHSPFAINWQNVSAGPYTLTARATDNNGIAKDSAPVKITVGTPIRVNFQLNGADIPEGYLPDYGDVFDDRGNGQKYGWDVDNTANARERNDAHAPDQRYDTFNHLQKPQPAGSLWEIEVPNGRYNVYAAVGEAANFDSTFDLTAEGVTIVEGVASDTVRFYEGIGAVTVSDGRLTLGNGPKAVNNKVCFVEIYSLPAQADAPEINAPTLSGGAITITWKNGGTLESAPAVTGPWTSTGDSDGSFTEPAAGPAKFYRVKQ